jgi:hypothetical protein
MQIVQGPTRWLLARSGAVPRQALRYAKVQATTGGDLLLADLVPGATYRVGPASGALVEVTASADGVLGVNLAGGEGLRFGLCPAPPQAGDDWQRLCGALPGTVTPTAGPTNPPISPAPTTPSLSLPWLANADDTHPGN